MGHLNGILARVGGNLNNNFQKSQMPGGGMLKLRFDRYITKAGMFGRIPGTGFQPLSVELGFWIPVVSGIPDSNAQDSRFHRQKFLGFRKSGFPNY